MAHGQARVPTESELKRLRTIAAGGRYDSRDNSLIDFSYLLGLRVMEIASLKLIDIVDGKGAIKSEIVLQPDQTKGGKSRTVYLSNKQLIKNLKQYLKDRPTGSYLFCTQKGGHFTPDTLQATFRRLYKKAGLEGCSSHSGRRYFATKLLTAGIDIKSVSTLMGHSSVNMTARYVETNPVTLSNAVANLL